MPLALGDYTAALRELLLPYIRDNFPKETIALDQFKKNAGVNQINDEFIAPVWTSRHGGVVNLGVDSNSLISSSGRTSSRATVPVETVVASFDITKLAMAASSGAKLAVASALESQAKTLSSDYARHVNRQIYGDQVGIVAQVSGSNSATNVELIYPNASLDDGRSIDWYGTINADISPTKYIAAGNHIGLGTGAAAVATVTAVNGGTSVTITTGPAYAANDSVYLVDGSGGGAGSSDFLGMRAALSSSTGTSTYAGLARSTNGWTPAFGSASEALNMNRMYRSYTNAREYAQSNSDKYVVFVNKTLYIKYGDILTSMRRTVNEIDLVGGFKGLEFAAGGNVLGVYLDYDVPDGEVLTIDMDSWTICQVQEVDWLEDPNGGNLLRLQNTISYQAVMTWFANILCLAPASNGRETRKTN